MILVTLLAALVRRTGLDLAWRLAALGLAAAALALAWVLRPRGGFSADGLLAAALTTVAALLAAGALAGRGPCLTPRPAPSDPVASGRLRACVALRAA